MTEELIKFKTAKLAKEKEFNLLSQGWYGTDNPAYGEPNKFHIRTYLTWDSIGEENSQKGTEIYSAPTQSLLQKWLREIHILDVFVELEDKDYFVYVADKREDTLIYESRKTFKTYEKALENGLYQALKSIKL